MLRFNRKIYTIEAIKSAIQAYKEFSNFKINKKAKYIEVSLKPTGRSNAETLKDEFANYVLFISSKSA